MRSARCSHDKWCGGRAIICTPHRTCHAGNGPRFALIWSVVASATSGAAGPDARTRLSLADGKCLLQHPLDVDTPPPSIQTSSLVSVHLSVSRAHVASCVRQKIEQMRQSSGSAPSASSHLSPDPPRHSTVPSYRLPRASCSIAQVRTRRFSVD